MLGLRETLLGSQSSASMAAFLLTWLAYLLSWPSILIVYLLLNLKSIPLSWHGRALYHYLRGHPGRPYDFQHASSSSSTKSPSSVVQLLFRPASITTRSPMLESDFNWHKSNSTYFSDLDISRLVLITRIYFAGFSKCSKELAAEGHTGRMSLTLGSVYCSFRRPLRLYDRYHVSSRVLAWDRKWLYIVSWFSRPCKKRLQKEGETEIIACALSKYVCKKGRFTVPPERLLLASGLLPAQGTSLEQTPFSARSSAVENASQGMGGEAQLRDAVNLQEPKRGAISEQQRQWSMDVETERLRGMDVASAFISLDDLCFSEVAQLLQV